MTLATALVTGDEPLPQLAEAAVADALAKAGLESANAVLLFLTPEFARHARLAVTAAARRAQCTQVAGGIAAGVFTESGWALDRPAAAAMVFGGGLSFARGDGSGDRDRGTPLMSYCNEALPLEWREGARRFGAAFSDLSTGVAARQAPVWQNSRVSEDHRCSVRIAGARLALCVSTGLRRLGPALPVELSHGYDLETIGGRNARAMLLELSRAHFGHDENKYAHALSALVFDAVDAASATEKTGEPDAADPTRAALAAGRPVAIVSVNADRTVTLAERVEPGQCIAWAMREPASAEAEMRRCVDRLAATLTRPAGALVFSCIGRGPYFYGGDDADLAAVRERFAALPIIGAYGTGQIVPRQRAGGGHNCEVNNSVVTALFSEVKAEAHTARGASAVKES